MTAHTKPFIRPRELGKIDTNKIATPVDLKEAPVKTLVEQPEVIEELPPVSAPVLADVPTHQRWWNECGIRHRQAIERQRAARGKLSAALVAWQRVTGEIITHEDLIRQHLASETQLRADVKAGLVSPRVHGQPGPSAIDQFAFATRRQGRGTGGGGAFRRGGVGQNELLRRQAEQTARETQEARTAQRAAMFAGK